MAPSDGNLAPAKALKCQNEVMDEYARALQTFAQLVVYGTLPEETFEPERRSSESFAFEQCVGMTQLLLDD